MIIQNDTVQYRTRRTASHSAVSASNSIFGRSRGAARTLFKIYSVLRDQKCHIAYLHQTISAVSTPFRHRPSSPPIVSHHVDGHERGVGFGCGRMKDDVAHHYESIPSYCSGGHFCLSLPHVAVAGTRYRSCPRPTQMFTQPSAPDMQAPNQANSASGGVITP